MCIREIVGNPDYLTSIETNNPKLIYQDELYPDENGADFDRNLPRITFTLVNPARILTVKLTNSETPYS